jgi:Domain of unknown function (DUF4386)
MEETTWQKCAGIAAFLVGLTSIAFGLLFLFAVPQAQKGPAPDALVSYATNPAPVEMATILLIIGSLAALVAVVGIYRQLREQAPGWAVLSLILGSAFAIVTAMDAAYTAFLFPWLSGLYAGGDAAVKAYATLSWNAPSPINPYDFVEFCLSGVWLLLTGVLIVRTGSFPHFLGYLALVAGIGLLALFVSTFTATFPLILGIGVPGAVIVGPLFWLFVGATFWRRAGNPPIHLAAQRKDGPLSTAGE